MGDESLPADTGKAKFVGGGSPFADVSKVCLLLRDMPSAWHVCGGWAIDLFLGRVTRAHKDVDISVARADQLRAHEFMRARGWTLEKAAGGRLEPWGEGELLPARVHGVWCRNEAHDPPFVELLFDEADAREFRFRRDPSVTLPLERASFETEVSETGVRARVLAPELVLLYKSKGAGANEEDFRNARRALGAGARAWLKGALGKVYGRHPWADFL